MGCLFFHLIHFLLPNFLFIALFIAYSTQSWNSKISSMSRLHGSNSALVFLLCKPFEAWAVCMWLKRSSVQTIDFRRYKLSRKKVKANRFLSRVCLFFGFFFVFGCFGFFFGGWVGLLYECVCFFSWKWQKQCWTFILHRKAVQVIKNLPDKTSLF